MTPSSSRQSTSPSLRFTPFAASQRPSTRPSSDSTDGIDNADNDGHDDSFLSHRDLGPTPTAPSTSATTTSSSLPPSSHAIIWDASDPRIQSIGSPAEGANDIEMEPMKGAGHRRRRSSLMQSVGSSYNSNSNNNSERVPRSRDRADSIRAPGLGLPEEPKISEEQTDDMPRHSLDSVDYSLSDEDLHDDEETGLNKKDKRHKRRKRRRNTLLDQRFVRGDEISAEEKKEADHNVVRSILVNTALIVLWYFFSLSISLYNKWMFDADRLNFSFPLFTTACHMLVQFFLAALVLYFVPSLRPKNASRSSDTGPEGSPMSIWFYLTRVGPCGTATGLDIGLSNTSLKFVTLTFYTMCKSSNLAFVLIFAFLFRLEAPTWRLVAIIATMTMGVILMVSGEVEFKLGGFILVLSAAFFSGFRWALTQIMLLRNPATSNPFSSIFFLAPVMFVVLMIIAIPVEGFSALFDGFRILYDEWGIVTPFFLLFPGCIAFLMTASEFALLQRTSVVTLSIAGIFKEVITISAAALVFDDQLTPVNAIGLATTTVAIIAYNWIKISKMRQDAQENVRRGHMGLEDMTSNSGSDNEDNAGEDVGLLGRNSSEMAENLVTVDGDILPNPMQDTQQESQEMRAAQAFRDK
ncbi:solute carrier family 35 member C2 [Sodiomyces alkalinus F11]|uniref:Solute carrier family 35 member C2 n=1 Tax=Sodiomyces alkalinus (strain CBS 110278 / VKM F-3762 / F11) TaxID=1314773 RepID=A0A3N2PSB3_SODAK|nr:solute carrier family 35 member C2 [Sodiomyces alkalinus F11]ROT37409.1 solute carrier family 35 member C2 [Sodiomyces alkalinus F11]